MGGSSGEKILTSVVAMGSPENSRSGSKREVDENVDLKNGGRGRDEGEDRDGSDRRKHRSSKVRKSSGGEDIEGDGSGRRKSTGERSEGRKRSSGSKYSDEDDYDVRRERERSKQSRRSKDESSLEKLSTYYQEGELDKDRGDKSAGREYSRGDDNERRNADGRSSKFLDSKRESSKEKSESYRDERVDRKSKVSESYYDTKSSSRDERRDVSDWTKSKGRSEEEDYKCSPNTREDKLGKESDEKYQEGNENYRESSNKFRESNEKHREDNERNRQPSVKVALDDVGIQEKPSSAGDDVKTPAREKLVKGVGRSSRSRTPERSEKCSAASEISEGERDRNYISKSKEADRDVYLDDRSRSRDDGYKDRNRDARDGSGDSWKRSAEPKSGDAVYSHSRERDYQRHGRDRNEGDRHYDRSSGNVIEIRTKPSYYERGESGSAPAKRTDADYPSSSKSVPNVDDWAYGWEDRGRRSNMSRPPRASDDSKERYSDAGTSVQETLWRDGQDNKVSREKGQRGSTPAGGQSTGSGSLPPYANHDQSRVGPQEVKGNRPGENRPSGRDGHQGGFPPPIMASPFGPFGMPPLGSMQPLNPGMSPAPGPPMSPYIPPVIWPGALPPGLSPLGQGPRFPPNPFYNHLVAGSGMPPNLSGPAFPMGPGGRGAPHDMTPGNWAQPKPSGPPGKNPSRGEQNDYSQNFVDTGNRPQNFIRELDATNVVEDYPKLRELIQKKDEIVANSSAPPMYYKCDLREHVLTPEFFGTKFDVILVDPPWEEYVHRAPGITDNMEYWTLEEIMNLKIEAIADTPSFIFLWVGDGVGLEHGRQCLKKWGFRRCEDICWVKTNKSTKTPGLRHDSRTLFQRSKEHCLMGIKGTVRRSTDGHIIHANIDTDVIIAEEPPYGSTAKPEDMYRIVEHFCLGRRRLELFGEDHNIREGWLTLGKGLTSSNFNSEAFIKNFADKDGKVWQGGGGRNPPPEAPHLVRTTPDIEALRPKSPMKNQQQLQQQSSSISINTANSSNKRPASGNMLPDSSSLSMMMPLDASGQMNPGPWPPGMMFPDVENMYGFNMAGPPFLQGNGEFMDFESRR